MELKELTDELQKHCPDILRWCGAIACRLREHNIAIDGKSSGNTFTDALTLADLTVQELAVAALRDKVPISMQCRIEAEEETGDLERFADESEYVISLDPIDGTRQYRDRTGDGWCVMLHVRTRDTVHYSLVFVPQAGPNGTWVEAVGDQIWVGEDDPSRPAREVLDAMPAIDVNNWDGSNQIYLIGFQTRDEERAENVTELGLKGVAPDDMPGSIYPLLASGEFGGSLIHSPNVYDYPVAMHLARILGGDSVWVHNGEPVNFDETWMDDRASMLRLPGIVATSPRKEDLKKMCELAKDWSKTRYLD
jgi:3'(2'), 5'-bisphosphate nucleotidase